MTHPAMTATTQEPVYYLRVFCDDAQRYLYVPVPAPQPPQPTGDVLTKEDWGVVAAAKAGGIMANVGSKSLVHLLSIIDRLNSRTPVQTQEWQPISTAPSDGTPIEAWHSFWSCIVTIGFNGMEINTPWIEKTKANRWPGSAFTHWRPLSIGPTEARGK